MADIDYRRLLKAYMKSVLDAEGVTFVAHGPYHGVQDQDTAELVRIEAEILAEDPDAGDLWPCDCGEVSDHKRGCPRAKR